MVAPVKSQRLLEANTEVRLEPCNHVISKLAAELLYGPMVAGECLKMDQRCKKCNSVVRQYFVQFAPSQKHLLQTFNKCGYLD